MPVASINDICTLCGYQRIQHTLALCSEYLAVLESKYAKFGEAPMSASMVNHPSHYNNHPSGIECITIAQEAPFNLGCAIKYIWRYLWGLPPKYGNLEDLRKARFYLDLEIKRQEDSKG